MRILWGLIITIVAASCGSIDNKDNSIIENPTDEDAKGKLIYPSSKSDSDMPFTMIIANKRLAVDDYIISNGEIVSQVLADTYCTFSVFGNVEPGEVSKVNAFRFDKNGAGRVVIEFGNSSNTFHTFAFGECVLQNENQFYTAEFEKTLGEYFRID